MILAEPLHPEVLLLLEAQRRAGGKPRAEMSVEETRQAMIASRKWQMDPPAGLPARDTVANGVPVRLYGPDTAHALLFLHGGRFFSGGLESHDAPLRMLAAQAGCQVCAVDYRLAPEHRHPAAVDDAIAAGRWLAGHAGKVSIGGDSAGGYLAAMASLELQSATQFLIYPMLDPAGDTASYREFQTGPWPNAGDMRRGWDLYGGTAVTANLGPFPPAFVVTAGTDPLRDEAMAFAAGLRARAIPAKLAHFADMHHGFFTQTQLSRSRELIALLAAELAR